MGSQDPVLNMMSRLYGSEGYADELAFAAALLHKATGAPGGSVCVGVGGGRRGCLLTGGVGGAGGSTAPNA